MTKTNTEKPTTKTEQKKQGEKKIVEQIKTKIEDKKPVEVEKKIEEKKEEKKTETKKEPKKIKKTKAITNAKNVPISTKDAVAICRFIKNKKIQTAIDNLEEIIRMKKAVPMKGEIPHRKGRIMSGRYPKKGSLHFIKILKGLLGNSNANDLNDPIILEAIANKASRPYGKFGQIKRKRTHVKIIAIEKNLLKNKRKKENKKQKKVKKKK